MDSGSIEEKLGVHVEGNKVIVHVFGKPYEIIKNDIIEPSGKGASLDICVILCKDLLLLDALPRVPVILLFNDADDEFPAQSSVLFEQRAEKYLDPECLAMAGRLLFTRLKQV